ncbi:MAG TPA: response regulator [Methylomirabilota bacterium]|jgi:two-component system response regulator PrrA
MSARDTRGGQRVLVVEDEPDLLATYERLLGRQGYEVTTATSRAGGLAAVRAATEDHRLDLVICDLRLHDDDGLEVVWAARGTVDPPSVIVITGYPSHEARRAASAAGATAFFAKPFVAAALLAAVRSSLAPSAPSGSGEPRP